MSSSRKRKQRPEFNTNPPGHNLNAFIGDDAQAEQVEHGPNLDSSLSIQAYEADIVRRQGASQAAASLEVFDYGTGTGAALPVRKIGDALIQWGEDQLGKPPEFPGDEDEFIGSSNLKQAAKSMPQNDEKDVVWVDRYAAVSP
jgi:hypothetical protein